MNQTYTYFFFDLTLKAPSETALIDGLDNFAEDTYEAAEFFNSRFQGIKKITILGVKGIILSLMLVYEKNTPDKVTAKELTVFSRHLYHELKWDRFTKEANKLFIPARIIPMNWWEAYTTVSMDYGRDYGPDSEDPEHELYFRWPSLWPDWAQHDFTTEVDEASNVTVSFEEDDDLLSSEESLTDEQLIAVLNSILATQNLGSKEVTEAKKSTIHQIKKLITPWAIR